MKTAYSYIRFSSAKQAGGDSFARQTAATASYCEKNGLLLDRQLKFADLAVSGFTGKNLVEGAALARFFSAVKAGLVPPGSALIVEAFDRLTRQKPRLAISLLNQILDAGIEVHFVRSGRVILPESDDGMELMMAVAEATAGYRESANKSARLLSAFAAKREQATAGQPAKVQGMLPWWLESTPEKKIICTPEKSDLLTRIFSMMASGASSIKISNALNAPPSALGRKWNPSTISRLIKSEAPLGFFLTPKGEIKGYYPAVISPDLAAEARSMQRKNSLVELGRPTKPGRLPNLLKGLIREAQTGVPLCLHYVQFKTKETGYYTARNHTTHKNVCRVNAAQLEGVLLAALAELTPEQIAPAEQKTDAREVRLKKQIEKLELKIRNLVEAVEMGSAASAKRLVEVEAEKEKISEELATAKLEAPRPVDTIPLAAVKSYTIADLQLAEKREEMAIALRKLVAKIDIATNFSSTLGFAPVDLPQFSRHFLASRSSAGPSFSTPDPTPQRGMREIVMAIHFRAGGSRWVFRSPGEPIVSSRFG